MTSADLRARRRALGLTQEELGRQLGIRRNTIARWERGDLAIGSPLLLRLALDQIAQCTAWNSEGEPAAGTSGAHTLPEYHGLLIGRAADLASVERALTRSTSRLVTLVGTGGVGKTRLAIAAATDRSSAFANGVTFVDLASVVEPAKVALSIAHALGLREAGPVPVLELVTRYLRTRQVLLVLDNFEHVLRAAGVVSHILTTCPRVSVLATSREPLHLSGERQIAVAPLTLPSEQQADVLSLSRSPAGQLFLERCQEVDPDFRLGEDNAIAVAGLCVGLDGLPLALELAAARIRSLPPQSISTHLTELGGLLGPGPVDRPARQRTLRATLDWSYGLLRPDEQALFRRVSIFTGSATLEAIEYVSTGSGSQGVEILTRLSQLVDKSLVEVEIERPRNPIRYRLLQTIRHYGLERLQDSGEFETTHSRHLHWYRELVHSASPQFWGNHQVYWLDTLEREYSNIAAAITRVLTSPARPADLEAALHLVGAAWPFWDIRAHLTEAREWISRLLELAPEGTLPELRAHALDAAGWLAYGQGDVTAALGHFDQAFRCWTDIGSRDGLAWSAAMQGLVVFNLGELQRAARLFDLSMPHARETNDRLLVAWSAFGQAHLHLVSGDLQGARQLLEAALAQGTEVFGPVGVAFGLFSLGQITLIEGDRRSADQLLRQCLGLRWKARDVRTLPETIEALAALAAADEQYERAARLFGAGEAVRGLSGAKLLPWLEQSHDAARRSTELALGQAAFARLWSDGLSYPLARAVEYGLDESLDPDAPRTGPSSQTQHLSKRELEVASMVADGLANREIAQHLGISERTVESHLEHVRGKLGVSSRIQVALWAARKARDN